METRIMARSLSTVFFLLATIAISPAVAQVPGQQSKPMGGVEQPDTSRIQEEMSHASNTGGGPLRIIVGKTQSDLTVQSLAALPHVTVKVYNEHAKASQTYSGIPVIELLKPLGVPEKPKGKEFLLYFIAEGSDGYQVVYSMAEATPDVHDATIIVADSMDGKPLGGNGPFQVVATGEKRPARWVRNLVSIRVGVAE